MSRSGVIRRLLAIFSIHLHIHLSSLSLLSASIYPTKATSRNHIHRLSSRQHLQARINHQTCPIPCPPKLSTPQSVRTVTSAGSPPRDPPHPRKPSTSPYPPPLQPPALANPADRHPPPPAASTKPPPPCSASPPSPPAAAAPAPKTPLASSSSLLPTNPLPQSPAPGPTGSPRATPPLASGARGNLLTVCPPLCPNQRTHSRTRANLLARNMDIPTLPHFTPCASTAAQPRRLFLFRPPGAICIPYASPGDGRHCPHRSEPASTTTASSGCCRFRQRRRLRAPPRNPPTPQFRHDVPQLSGINRKRKGLEFDECFVCAAGGGGRWREVGG